MPKKRTKLNFRLAVVIAVLTIISGLGTINYVHNLNSPSVLGAKEKASIEINYLYEAKQAVLDSSQVISGTAETILQENRSVTLNVPLIYQQYELSCEAATIQMALEFKEIYKNQDELMNDIGFAQPSEVQTSGDSLIWGDPDLGFVGSYKGKYTVVRSGALVGGGWGVHEGPVLNAVQKYRAGSWLKNNASVDDLKQALYAQMPVIFWHVRENHDKETLEYLTPAGKRIIYKQFHVKALIGYNVDEKGLETWVFNDPIYGKQTQTTEQMLQEWTKYGQRMVAVA